MSGTAFLFSGQGAQYPGMFLDVYEKYPCVKMTFEEADEALGRRISDVILHAGMEEINQTENTQPALLTVEIAMARLLEQEEIFADFAAGFSLGEWAALVNTRVLAFPTALRMVQLRAGAMQRAVPPGQGAMAAIMGRSAEFVQTICARAEGYVVPSNYNCPGQITVSGEKAAVETVVRLAAEEGAAATLIPVSVPSHCRLMEPAAEELAAQVGQITFSAPRCPIYLNTTGGPTVDMDVLRKEVISQLFMPVEFEKTIVGMMAGGADKFVEIGPGRTLSGFVKRTAKAAGRNVEIYRVDGAGQLGNLLHGLQGELLPDHHVV